MIVTNPPYNSDLYVDILNKIYKTFRYNMIAIIPAKWTDRNGMKGSNNYEYFREYIVPHVDKVIKYRDAWDVFEIGCPDGISILKIDSANTEKHNTKLVKFKCKLNKNFEQDWEEHSEDKLELIPNRIRQILNKVKSLAKNPELTMADAIGFKRAIYIDDYFKPYKTRKSADDVEIHSITAFEGYASKYDLKTIRDIEMFKCIQTCMPVSGAGRTFSEVSGDTLGGNMVGILKPYQIPKAGYKEIANFDNIDECISLKSYMESELVRFLYFCGVCGVQISGLFYKYVPFEDDWGIIYEDRAPIGVETDADGKYVGTDGKTHMSLYNRYKLSEDDIKIIESIIRPRKTK